MDWRDLIVAAMAALMLGALFVSALRWPRTGDETTRVGGAEVAMVVFMLLLGGLWITLGPAAQLGPVTWVGTFLQFMVAAAVAMLVTMAIVVMRRRRRGGRQVGPA